MPIPLSRIAAFPAPALLTGLTPLLLSFLLLLLFASSAPASAERRIALVIGNGAYAADPLRNPVNDAQDITAALRQVGFEVEVLTNAGHKAMDDAIHRLYERLRGGGVGLFYYAGHGIQVNGQNYLIPVDATLRSESDIRFRALDAGQVLGKMEDAGNHLNIVILDACRNNPFERAFRGTSRGLARMAAPLGTFIAYATEPGSLAADGTGRNGVFTKHLLQHLTVPGLDLENVFKRTRVGVVRETNGQQVPWDSSSLLGDFHFALGATPPPPPPPPPPPDSPTAGKTWTENFTGMEFVWVPGDCFMMGQTEAEKRYLLGQVSQEDYDKWFKSELPRHEVCVDGFWMGRHEVTVGQFRQFVGETGHRSDAHKQGKAWIRNKDTEWKWQERSGYHWENPGFTQTERHPVVTVSWNDAQAFAKWLSGKSGEKIVLPTEAQWEYAARGGSTTMRFWGDEADQACTYANVADKAWGAPRHECTDGYQFTAPVGNYKPNPFGLYDMLGNVWEWVEDVFVFDAYTQSNRANNPVVTGGGSNRVFRGGSWRSGPGDVRSASATGSRRPSGSATSGSAS